MRCKIFSTVFTKFPKLSARSSILGSILSIVLLSNFSHASAHDDLKLSGIASYWNLNNEIYVGTIRLESPVSSAQSILEAPGLKRLEFKVTQDKWRQRNFAKTWSRSIIINNDSDFQTKYGTEINKFSNMLKDALLYGDKVTVDLTPNEGVTATVNDITLFKTNKSGFFNGLINVWVGPRPPSTTFKQEIIKLSSSSTNNIARYEQIVPAKTEQRKNAIAAWVEPPKKKTKKAKPAPVKATTPKPAKAEVAASEAPKAEKTETKQVNTKPAEPKVEPTPVAAEQTKNAEPKTEAIEPETAQPAVAKPKPSESVKPAEPVIVEASKEDPIKTEALVSEPEVATPSIAVPSVSAASTSTSEASATLTQEQAQTTPNSAMPTSDDSNEPKNVTSESIVPEDKPNTSDTPIEEEPPQAINAHETSLAAEVEAAKAALQEQALAEEAKKNTEQQAAESNFDDLISQLEEEKETEQKQAE